MDAEAMREHLLGLPHVCETEQFGGVVFWVGDKALGGRMFAWMELDDPTGHVFSFPASADARAALLKRDGVVPAPYLARAGWVTAKHWRVLDDAAWRAAMDAAHALIRGKLSRQTLAWLQLPKRERKAVLTEQRAVYAARAEREQQRKQERKAAVRAAKPRAAAKQPKR